MTDLVSALAAGRSRWEECWGELELTAFEAHVEQTEISDETSADEETNHDDDPTLEGFFPFFDP